MTRGGDRSAWTRASLGEDERWSERGGARERARSRLQTRASVAKSHEPFHWPLSQWCARSAVVPPRPIPNRVVKHGSAEGTGGMPAGRVGPCTHLSRRGAVAARRAHNPKVDGSNPSAATTSKAPAQLSLSGRLFLPSADLSVCDGSAQGTKLAHTARKTARRPRPRLQPAQ